MTENDSDLQLQSWAAMVATFHSEGLPEPPIPTGLRPSLGETERWRWSTRPISAMGMYLFRDPADEVCAGPVADYVAVSHAGHGSNSYAINYHLVYRNLALFTQVGWGGAYSNKARSTVEVAELFGSVQSLIDVADEAAEAPALCRLVCLFSSLRPQKSAVGWVMPPQEAAVTVRHLREQARSEAGSVLSVAERLSRAGPCVV